MASAHQCLRGFGGARVKDGEEHEVITHKTRTKNSSAGRGFLLARDDLEKWRVFCV